MQRAANNFRYYTTPRLVCPQDAACNYETFSRKKLKKWPVSPCFLFISFFHSEDCNIHNDKVTTKKEAALIKNSSFMFFSQTARRSADRWSGFFLFLSVPAVCFCKKDTWKSDGFFSLSSAETALQTTSERATRTAKTGHFPPCVYKYCERDSELTPAPTTKVPPKKGS